MHHIGEQHGHLLVLGLTVHGGDGRTARIAESGAVARFGAARAARYRHPIILTPRQKPGP